MEREENPRNREEEEDDPGFSTPILLKPLISSYQPRNPTPCTPVPPSSKTKPILLSDWWLICAERAQDGKRLGIGGVVAGRYRRKAAGCAPESLLSPWKKAERVFESAPIAKRYDTFTLGTADGVTVRIQGVINKSRSHHNGFPLEVCNSFLIGFPYNWDDYADACFRGNSNYSSVSFHLDEFSLSRIHDVNSTHDAPTDDFLTKFRNFLERFCSYNPVNPTTKEFQSKYEREKNSQRHDNGTDHVAGPSEAVGCYRNDLHADGVVGENPTPITANIQQNVSSDSSLHLTSQIARLTAKERGIQKVTPLENFTEAENGGIFPDMKDGNSLKNEINPPFEMFPTPVVATPSKDSDNKEKGCRRSSRIASKLHPSILVNIEEPEFNVKDSTTHITSPDMTNNITLEAGLKEALTEPVGRRDRLAKRGKISPSVVRRLYYTTRSGRMINSPIVGESQCLDKKVMLSKNVIIENVEEISNSDAETITRTSELKNGGGDDQTNSSLETKENEVEVVQIVRAVRFTLEPSVRELNIDPVPTSDMQGDRRCGDQTIVNSEHESELFECSIGYATTSDTMLEMHPIKEKKLDVTVSRPRKKHRAWISRKKRSTRHVNQDDRKDRSLRSSSRIIWRAGYVNQFPLTRDMAKKLDIASPESLNLKRSRSGRLLVPPLATWCQKIIYAADGEITGITGENLGDIGSRSEPPRKKKKLV